MKRLIAAALLVPVAGCSALIGGFGRRDNIECHDYAYSGLIELAIASVVGALSYSEDGGSAAYVVSGVFVASSLGGFTGAIVCDAREEKKHSAAVYYPRGSNQPPESLRLDPNGSEVRDATPEEMGIAPGQKHSTDLSVHPDPPPAPEQVLDTKVGQSYKTGADGYSPPNRDGQSAPTQQPPPPPLPTCQLSPRIDCPEKTHCVLTEENRGVCTPLP